MKSDLLDVVGDILEILHLGLPTCIHHPDDCVEGGGERVELLLESYD